MENTQVKELERSLINYIKSVIRSVLRNCHSSEKVKENKIYNTSRVREEDNLPVL